MRIDLFRVNGFYMDEKFEGYYCGEHSSKKYEFKSGVYVLIKHKEIVYIGVTENLHSRIQSHIKSNNIEFDLICVILDDTQLISPVLLESVLLNVFFPKHNKRIPRIIPKEIIRHKTYTKTEKEIQKVFDSKESRIMKFLKTNKDMFKLLSEF